MLFIVFLLLALWFLGFMTSATLGGLLHIIQGSSVGAA